MKFGNTVAAVEESDDAETHNNACAAAVMGDTSNGVVGRRKPAKTRVVTKLSRCDCNAATTLWSAGEMIIG